MKKALCLVLLALFQAVAAQAADLPDFSKMTPEQIQKWGENFAARQKAAAEMASAGIAAESLAAIQATQGAVREIPFPPAIRSLFPADLIMRSQTSAAVPGGGTVRIEAILTSDRERSSTSVDKEIRLEYTAYDINAVVWEDIWKPGLEIAHQEASERLAKFCASPAAAGAGFPVSGDSRCDPPRLENYGWGVGCITHCSGYMADSIPPEYFDAHGGRFVGKVNGVAFEVTAGGLCSRAEVTSLSEGLAATAAKLTYKALSP